MNDEGEDEEELMKSGIRTGKGLFLGELALLDGLSESDLLLHLLGRVGGSDAKGLLSLRESEGQDEKKKNRVRRRRNKITKK